MRIVAWVLFVLVCLTPVASASGETSCDCDIRLAPGESIQDAIDQAPDGSVICLAAGSWQETIEIHKPLTLCGSGQAETYITGSQAGYPSLSISTPEGFRQRMSVIVRDLTIRRTPGECHDYAKGTCAIGLAIRGLSDAAVESVTLSDNPEYGLSVRDQASVRLVNATVSGNGNDGLEVKEQAHLFISASTIEHNTYNGAVVQDNARLELEDCTIEANGHNGLTMLDTAQASVVGCEIDRNEFCGICQHTNDCPPYGFRAEGFYGAITGYGNWIPGADHPDGNRLGTSCPVNWAADAGLIRESPPTAQEPASVEFAIDPDVTLDSVVQIGNGPQVLSTDIKFYPNTRQVSPGETVYWTLDLGGLQGPFSIVPELDNDNDPESLIQASEHRVVIPFTYLTANVYVPFVTVTDRTGIKRKVYSSEVVAVMPQLAPRNGLGLKLPTPTDPAGDYIKGMNIFTFDYTLFGSEDGERFVQGELDRIAALGCNMVIFDVAWFNDTETSSIQEPIYGDAWPACWVGTLSVDAFVKLADWCHERGMRVCFRYFLREKGDGSGAARAYYTPADPELYIAQQTQIKVEYARLCDALGVELYCLDSENQFFTRESAVSSLIHEVRAVYRGATTNGAWSASANYSCPYAGELDVLSWSDYNPLVSNDFAASTPVEELTRVYLFYYVNTVRPLLALFGKPGLVIETGVNIRETDTSQVERLYLAYLDAFARLQKTGAPLCGNAWWVWNLSARQVEPHAMRGKSAEGILREYFSSKISGAIVADFAAATNMAPPVDTSLESFEAGMPVYEVWQQASSIETKIETGGPQNDHCLAIHLEPSGEDADVRYGFVWSTLRRPSDWSGFASFNFWLKSAATNWGVEVNVCDSDGDRFNIRVETEPFLTAALPETEGWQLVSIPFAIFTKPSWAEGGNGTLNWREVVRFGFGLIYQNHGAQTIWLDDIYLSREGTLP